MAGVVNRTARQYNIKTLGKKGIVTVRLKPGFNVVEDAHWKVAETNPYTKALKVDGKIDYGSSMKKDEAKADKDQVAQTKETPSPEDTSKKSDDATGNKEEK